MILMILGGIVLAFIVIWIIGLLLYFDSETFNFVTQAIWWFGATIVFIGIGGILLTGVSTDYLGKYYQTCIIVAVGSIPTYYYLFVFVVLTVDELTYRKNRKQKKIGN